MAISALACVALLLWLAFILSRGYLKRQATIRKHGCKPPPSLTGRETGFGIDPVYLLLNSSRRGSEKLADEELFKVMGSTFQTQRFIKPIIQTIDPRNLQAMFTSDSFGNGPLRQFAFSPLVGVGVMTLDGARHERARTLIRPAFSRALIENEASYNVHVENVLKLLPTDGSTVDLQLLFERLDLDSATEFVFGESVASLTTDSMIATHKFPAVFSRAQQGMGARFKMLPFNFLHRDKGFWDACSTSRRFVSHSVDEAIRRRDMMEDKNHGRRSYVLVDNLLAETQNKREIEDALMNVFLPGT